MITTPGCPGAPVSSATSASLTTSTRDLIADPPHDAADRPRHRSGDRRRRCRGRSPPGTLVRSPSASSITWCRTFSTCSSPAAWRLAPLAAHARENLAVFVGEQADGLGAAGVDADDVLHSGVCVATVRRCGPRRRPRAGPESGARGAPIESGHRSLYGLGEAQVNAEGAHFFSSVLVPRRGEKRRRKVASR